MSAGNNSSFNCGGKVKIVLTKRVLWQHRTEVSEFATTGGY